MFGDIVMTNDAKNIKTQKMLVASRAGTEFYVVPGVITCAAWSIPSSSDASDITLEAAHDVLKVDIDATVDDGPKESWQFKNYFFRPLAEKVGQPVHLCRATSDLSATVGQSDKKFIKSLSDARTDLLKALLEVELLVAAEADKQSEEVNQPVPKRLKHILG